jgi:DUF971 family protein/molybdopterin converting factor small subunit
LAAIDQVDEMSNETPIPLEINLHQKSRKLTISFSDGASFDYPSEYLRVFSPAAEVKASSEPVTGKESVNIKRIEPQGQYAIRLIFDDGHDTGIYSWETLYELGQQWETKWQAYLQRLEAIGYQRGASEVETDRRITIYYFSWLVQKLGKQSEEMILPASVSNIETLLTLLRRRRPDRADMLEMESIRPTVNKQFAESFTLLEDGDEVGLIPLSPTPPATPSM